MKALDRPGQGIGPREGSVPKRPRGQGFVRSAGKFGESVGPGLGLPENSPGKGHVAWPLASGHFPFIIPAHGRYYTLRFSVVNNSSAPRQADLARPSAPERWQTSPSPSKIISRYYRVRPPTERWDGRPKNMAVVVPNLIQNPTERILHGPPRSPSPGENFQLLEGPRTISRAPRGIRLIGQTPKSFQRSKKRFPGSSFPRQRLNGQGDLVLSWFQNSLWVEARIRARQLGRARARRFFLEICPPNPTTPRLGKFARALKDIQDNPPVLTFRAPGLNER